jgi:Beta-ketoacyl synthase, N-terminal domain
VRVDFSITNWAAWAPGLTSQDGWRAWAQSPVAPRGAEMPPLTEVPAMARRRVEKMGRLAFQVATWCEGEARGLPLIFASRHGDAGRSVELLSMLARGESLSPTSFALSVHNAIGAQFSIIRGDTANVTALSNGLFTLEAGILEATMLLTESPEVMLVVYDASPPLLYAPYFDEPAADFAFAWRIAPGTDFSLERTEPGPSPNDALPHGLGALRFFLGTEPSWAHADDTLGWRWSRRG